MCENVRVLPLPASMLVLEATVCRSVSFICANKGFVIWFAGVCDGTGKIEVRIDGGLVF